MNEEENEAQSTIFLLGKVGGHSAPEEVSNYLSEKWEKSKWNLSCDDEYMYRKIWMGARGWPYS